MTTSPDTMAVAPRIGHNRWDQLAVPSLASGREPTCTVVVPVRDRPFALRRCLAALRAQDYPLDRLEIVIVDDASDPPLDPTAYPGTRVEQMQDLVEFGAGRARNRGVAVSDSEIVLFVDADIIVGQGYVRAHAEVLSAVPYAVTLGHRHFVDVDDLDGDEVARAVTAGSLETLFTGRAQHPHEWIERVYDRSDDLAKARRGAFRVVVGAGLGVRRSLLCEVGGFTEFGRRGIEDIELGYKLFAMGAMIMPVRRAQSWHQGRRHFDSETSAQATRQERAPLAANHIPVPEFRPHGRRSWTVPRLVATVETRGSSTDQVLACLEDLCSQRLADFRVLVVEERQEVTRQVREWFAGEPRVEVAAEGSGLDRWPLAWVHARVPVAARLTPEALEKAVARLDRESLGALHLSVTECEGSMVMLDVLLTRAQHRVERLRHRTEDPDDLLGALYGERWLSGYAFGIGNAMAPPTPESTNETTIASLREQVRRLRSRRAIRTADAVGRMVRTIGRTFRTSLLALWT